MGAASLVQESEDSGSRFCGEAAWRYCAVNATILPAVPQCNPGGPVGPSRADVPTVPGHASRSARGSKGEGVRTTRVRTAEARRARRPARSGLARSASVGQTLRPRHQERINALPRPLTSRHDQPTLPGHGRQGCTERQSPHGRQVRPTIESMTGRRASSIWVGSRLEPGVRIVRTAKRPSPHGAVFVARRPLWDARSTLRLAAG